MTISHSNKRNLPRGMANKLIQQIPSLELGKNIFIEDLPAKVGESIVIFEMPSTKYNAFAQANRRTLDIQARAETASAARQLCWNVFDAINIEDTFMEIGDETYPFYLANTPTKLGIDEQGRVTFAFMIHIIYF